MTTYFDLWDIESGNIIDTFETMEEALAIVVQLLDAFGDGYAGDLALGRIDGEEFRPIATGAPLVDLARNVPTNGARTPATVGHG